MRSDLLESQDEFHVRQTPWYLDARRQRPWNILTHAHSDHLGRHRQTLATPATLALMTHRLKSSPRRRTIPLAYRRPFRPEDHPDLPPGSWQLELFPAGHVLGSAMVRLETPEGSLLYTGDFRLRSDALTVEACQVPQADYLLMECTYGLPHYRFPPRQEVLEDFYQRLAESLRAGRQPVCLCYSLGKAQEIACLLTRQGFRVLAHPSILAIATIYQDQGVELGQLESPETLALSPGVLLLPPMLLDATLIRNAEYFLPTGWALDRSHSTHHLLPLSDHADFSELEELIDRVRPRQIFLTHGFVEEFTAHLRRRGLEAFPAVAPAQGRLFE